jgi:hypothetical protein
VRLVIANSARQAVTVVDGKSILPNRTRDAGLIFFNDEGDENGGMTWSGRREKRRRARERRDCRSTSTSRTRR